MVSLKEAIALIAALFIVIFLAGGIFIFQDYRIQRADPLSPSGTQTTERTTSSSQYGCPGCPANFMDFAQDMCNTFGPGYTVSDGTNTLLCAEIMGGGTK